MGLTLSENGTAFWNIDKINFMKTGKSLKCTRPSVNSAKDWFGQLFLFPGWSGLEKGFNYGCDQQGAVNSHFPVYMAIFGKVTTERTTKQPGDPSASLLLTSEKAVFCKIPLPRAKIGLL